METRPAAKCVFPVETAKKPVDAAVESAGTTLGIISHVSLQGMIKLSG